MRFLNLACVLGLVAAACQPSGRTKGGPIPEALRGLPPRTDPPLDLSDDDDLGRARGLYDAMDVGDQDRAARRRELWAAYAKRVDAQLKDSRETAFELFQGSLSLWAPSELADAGKAPEDLELAAELAQRFFDLSSANGRDLESVTALTVLIAARPNQKDELLATWSEIAAYLDDLAVAERGPGAERSRTIEVLEAVTAYFPSRWAGDTLVQLYVARQAALVGMKNPDLDDFSAQGLGALYPTWNLIRIYARMDRLDEAAAAVDALSGQLGDDDKLREALHQALDAKADGDDWNKLASAFLDDERRLVDIITVLRVCKTGASRLPAATAPRKLCADLARATGQVAVAFRYADEARAIDPGDRTLAETIAPLRLARLSDFVFSERLSAARSELKAIEEFYADVDKRWPGQPLELTLADAHLIYGRGLLSVGEVDEAQDHLKKAFALEPSAQALEQMATISLKRGDWLEAARGFEAAAAIPQETPLLQKVEGARLRRLAGEAYLEAGEKLKATTLWTTALGTWREVLGAALEPGRRSEGYTEVGRLEYNLGNVDEALASFEHAVDSEQPGVYADVIAFLMARGYYEQAHDTYIRELGRPDVTEYIKVYTSLWIIDLARVQGRKPDPLAIRFLEGRNGTRWYHELARFATGRQSWDQVLAKADTRGKRAEAYFYQAMERFIAGDRPGADKLLKNVVETEMLGFFEYDMSRYFLKNGPPLKGR